MEQALAMSGAFISDGEALSPTECVRRIVSEPASDGWFPSGIDRGLYLDIVERIVRIASAWVDASGAVIDPVLNYEASQTSPRFASSCAVLIRNGRCLEQLDLLCRVMDHCCDLLSSEDSVNHSPDFWMRELATAYDSLKGLVSEERMERWRQALAKVVPERNYKCVSPDVARRHELHNWAVYSAAGESMRESFGIPGPAGELWGNAFFDAYVRHQLWRFNAYGMYRDPDDPITYDITTRLQFEAALAAGYNGIWRDGLRPILDDAMMATLLFMAPTGEVPFGGRSSQFHFQEGIISALCELAASRCQARGDMELAGAFKRQAHLSAKAVAPWLLRDDTLFILKNHFPPSTKHGCDGYGHVSVYSLYAASVFSLAAIYADDSIPEGPAPSEQGGFAFVLSGSFHKAFCNFSGNYLEFDLKPNPHHDACGLGRVLLKGMPWGILPVLPFPKEPHYTLAPGIPKNEAACSIAPEWTDKAGNRRNLAEWADSEGEFETVEPGVCRVVYHAWNADVIYRADIRTPGRLALEVEIAGEAQEASLILPVLKSDGGNETPEAERWLKIDGGRPVEAGTATNRTGIYKKLRIPFEGNCVRVRLSTKR